MNRPNSNHAIWNDERELPERDPADLKAYRVWYTVGGVADVYVVIMARSAIALRIPESILQPRQKVERV